MNYIDDLKNRIANEYITHIQETDSRSILSYIIDSAQDNVIILDAIKNGIIQKLEDSGILTQWKLYKDSFQNKNNIEIKLTSQTTTRPLRDFYYLFEVSIDNVQADIPYSLREVNSGSSNYLESFDFNELNDYVLSQVGTQNEDYRLSFYFDIYEFLTEEKIESISIRIEPEDLSDFLKGFFEKEIFNISDDLKKDMENKAKIINSLAYIIRSIPFNEKTYIAEFPVGTIKINQLIDRIKEFHDIFNIRDDIKFFKEEVFESLEKTINDYQNSLKEQTLKLKI